MTSILKASMGDRPKAPQVPAPRPKAKNRARHAVAHVTQGVTRMEVDGVPMSVEQSGNAKSLEFAAQVEGPNGRKVKIAGRSVGRSKSILARRRSCLTQQTGGASVRQGK